MTYREVADFLQINPLKFKVAINAAIDNHSLPKFPTDFYLSTLETVLKYYDKPINQIRLLLLQDTLKDVKPKSVDPYIIGMKEYLEKCFVSNVTYCCETCTYLSGKTTIASGTQVRPYCSFYEASLSKYNIFKDRCKTYLYKKRPPILWYKKGFSPKNDTSNGIDKDNVIHLDD